LVHVSLVVPVYNEELAVTVFVQTVTQALALPDIELEIVFVNDGSTDRTLQVLLDLQRADDRICVVDLTRNFGKEAALTAGLHHARGDVVIPLDADLQDPPDLIPAMIGRWREGYEVVLARRVDRSRDSFLKRWTARWYYRVHNHMADKPLPADVGDFRLMDRAVVEALKQLPESRRFMKGLFAWLGFRTTTVDYTRPERVAGVSKFNGWRLWNFALEGITSFSITPLRVWTYCGLIVSLLSFLFAAYVALRVVLYGIDVPGYASLMVAVTFLGGLQLIGIGVIGEYLGRTYIESKRRPIYLVRRIHQRQD
jgi:glycosyltransferase involved in cell wall biosynthesis